MLRFERSVVCVSGGMDSAVTAAIAALESAELLFLHVNYGQRTQRKELDCFQRLADHYRSAGRLVAELGHFTAIGGSSLTNHNMVVEAADLNRRSVPTSYVPFRNANILGVAVSWAEAAGAQGVYLGAVAGDSSGYPDCREEFFTAFQRVVETGTKPGSSIQVCTPVIGMSKADIVRKGMELGTPFELTWSCYQDEEAACGRCDSCALRLRGFQQAGFRDPLPYR